MSDAKLLHGIIARVESTICETFGSKGSTVEGRISQADWIALIDLIDRIRAAEREMCAQLHEQVDPASDDERFHKIPGAGAMAAVIQYRDLIRKSANG